MEISSKVKDMHIHLSKNSFFLGFCLFVRERGRERQRASTSRRSGRQKEKQAPRVIERSPMRDLIPEPWDHDLS